VLPHPSFTQIVIKIFNIFVSLFVHIQLYVTEVGFLATKSAYLFLLKVGITRIYENKMKSSPKDLL